MDRWSCRHPRRSQYVRQLATRDAVLPNHWATYMLPLLSIFMLLSGYRTRLHCEKIQQDKIQYVAQRAVVIDRETQYAVFRRFHWSEDLYIVQRHFFRWRRRDRLPPRPIFSLQEQNDIEDFSDHEKSGAIVRAKDHHQHASGLPAISLMPPSNFLPLLSASNGAATYRHVHFKDCAMVSARQERLVFREREALPQPGVLFNTVVFSHPPGQRADPADVVKVAVNVQRTLQPNMTTMDTSPAPAAVAANIAPATKRILAFRSQALEIDNSPPLTSLEYRQHVSGHHLQPLQGSSKSRMARWLSPASLNF